MKLSVFFAIATAIVTPAAVASVANFGPTSQNITLTGLGGNSAGEGQVRVTWGSCNFDGTNTTCTVSAPFLGVGSGGTISSVLTYSGSGISPLTAVSLSPGSNQVTLQLASGSFVTTLAESNGTTLTFDGEVPFFQYNGATCTGVSPANCTVGQIGLTVGATITGQVTGTFDPTPVVKSVISAGAYGAFHAIAPATWIEIYGVNLATNPPSRTWEAGDFNGVNAPTTLEGTTVTIGGQPAAAFIDFASPGQVNAQVPSSVSSGQQPVVVTTAGGSSVPYNIQVNTIQPGLLAPPVFQVNGVQYVVALFPDGVTYVLPPGITNAVPTRRARPGDTILLYGIGFGAVTPSIPAGQIEEQSNTLQSQVQVFFGGTQAQVAYQGLTPTFVGLYQFNVVVPNIAPSDSVPLTFSVGNVTGTQSMVIAIGS